MLKAIGFVLKCTLFAVLVLILGNWIKWDNRTASERVTHWIHRVQRVSRIGAVGEVGDQARQWARGLTSDAKAAKDQAQGSQSSPQREGRPDPSKTDSISPSERQKLRALIRELNSSHRQD